MTMTRQYRCTNGGYTTTLEAKNFKDAAIRFAIYLCIVQHTRLGTAVVIIDNYKTYRKYAVNTETNTCERVNS